MQSAVQVHLFPHSVGAARILQSARHGSPSRRTSPRRGRRRKRGGVAERGAAAQSRRLSPEGKLVAKFRPDSRPSVGLPGVRQV